MPGVDFGAAVRLVVDQLPDLPHLPELPDRGTVADLTGRGVATIGELGFDLQPAGWRLTDAPGVDHRRARSLLAQDLDVLEEELQDYRGQLKVQVAGPWTLASTIEKPRGDKVLSDLGARRELAQALAEGVRLHLADVQRTGARRLAGPAARRAGVAVRPGGTGADCLGLQPAPLRHSAAGAGLAGVGPRCSRRRRHPGALLRRRGADRPAAPLRRRRESPSTSRSSARPPTSSWRRRSTRAPGCSWVWCRRRVTRLRRPRPRWSARYGCWTCSASTGKRSPTRSCSRLLAGWPVRVPAYAKSALGAVRAAAAELG